MQPVARQRRKGSPCSAVHKYGSERQCHCCLVDRRPARAAGSGVDERRGRSQIGEDRVPIEVLGLFFFFVVFLMHLRLRLRMCLRCVSHASSSSSSYLSCASLLLLPLLLFSFFFELFFFLLMFLLLLRRRLLLLLVLLFAFARHARVFSSSSSSSPSPVSCVFLACGTMRDACPPPPPVFFNVRPVRDARLLPHHPSSSNVRPAVARTGLRDNEGRVSSPHHRLLQRSSRMTHVFSHHPSSSTFVPRRTSSSPPPVFFKP